MPTADPAAPPAGAPRLMLVTDRALVPAGALPGVVGAAVAGGVDTVQVREKDLPDDALLALVRAIQRLVAGRAAVLVNDRPAVARAAGAGLHLPEAAGLSGGSATDWPLWGRSVHDPAAAAISAAAGAGYVVAGPLFATTSHPGAPPLGAAGLRRIVDAAGVVPVVAIGGITPPRVAAARRAGARGVAARSDLLTAPDPERAARLLRQALDAAL